MNTGSKFEGSLAELNLTYEQLTAQYGIPDGEPASAQEQLANAQHIVGACDVALTGTTPPPESVVERYNKIGSRPWIGDITRSLIRNDVLTLEPAGLNVAEAGWNGRDEYVLAVAGLLRAIAPQHNRMSVVSIHHQLSARAAPSLHKSIARLMTGGALLEGDILGEQFAIIPSRMFEGLADAPDDFIDQLRSSQWGELDSGESGLYFRGTPELAAVGQVRSSLPKYGNRVVIKTLADEDSLPLLHARALQEVISGPQHNHLVLSDSQWMSFYGGVFALLRATNSIKHHQFHTVVSSMQSHMTKDQFSHLIGAEFREHAQRFITATTAFADFDVFDSSEYADRNYGGEEALLDDQNICKIVSFVLSKLGIKNAKAVDIGCGPNPYPAMLLAPYARFIDLLEFSPPSRVYMSDFLSGQLPESKMQIWPKFPRYMVEGGGEPYENVLPLLLQMAAEGRVRVQFGDAHNLAQEKWELGSMYFVDDSISPFRSDQREIVASACKAITFEGLLIAANMLNDKDHLGYTAGDGKVYPNISQNIIELKQGYTDNDMYTLVIQTSGAEKARAGYSGMALTLAAHSGSAMHKKLEALKPQLKEMGFTIL
jgi:hypothetical protein